MSTHIPRLVQLKDSMNIIDRHLLMGVKRGRVSVPPNAIKNTFIAFSDLSYFLLLLVVGLLC